MAEFRAPRHLLILSAGSLCLLTGCSGGEALFQWLESASTESPFLVLLVLAAATVTSEDLACVTAGVLVSKGTLSFLMAVSGCLMGIVASDVGLFLLGKWWGERILRVPPISWFVTPKRLDLGKTLYKRYGGALVISSRFLPGTRMLAYIAAGMLGYSWKRFILYMSLACAVWTPVIVGFAMLFGGAIATKLESYQKWALLGFPLAILAVWLFLKVFFKITEALHPASDHDD